MSCFIFHKWVYSRENDNQVRLCLKCKRKQQMFFKDRISWHDTELNKQEVRDNQLDKLL